MQLNIESAVFAYKSGLILLVYIGNSFHYGPISANRSAIAVSRVTSKQTITWMAIPIYKLLLCFKIVYKFSYITIFI